MTENKMPQWRVKMWFLDMRKGGWVGLEYPFLNAKDRDKAIMYCTQRATDLGFTVDKETKIEARYEDGSDKL